MKTCVMCILLLAAIGALPATKVAAEQGPSHQSVRKSSRAESGDRESGNVGAWLASLFRDHISKVDGDRCPSFPTCSSYSVQVFRKHGFIMGWMMTVDRLFHEGSEEKAVSPLIYDRGKLRIYDPVENNDFWWYRQHPEEHE